MVRSNGAWVQLRNYIEPAVAEARRRKDLLSRRRRANQHLFDREERSCQPRPALGHQTAEMRHGNSFRRKFPDSSIVERFGPVVPSK